MSLIGLLHENEGSIIINILNKLEYIPFKGNNPKKLYKDQGYYSCVPTILEELYNDLCSSNSF